MLVLNFGVSSVLPAVILFEYPLKKLSVNSIITSEGVLGEIPCGFPLGTQYKFLIPFPFISFLTALALFKPILISLAAVSSASIYLHKSSKVTGLPSPVNTPVDALPCLQEWFSNCSGVIAGLTKK